MKTKAQVWSFDLMAGLALFLIGIVIFFTYSINQPSQARETLELLNYEGNLVAESILSEGSPTNWTPENVISLGLTTSGKINQSKLENLYKIIYTDSNYTKTQSIFGIQSNYYISLEENITINSNSMEGIGKPGTNKQSIQARNLIKITRFTIYQNKTTPLYIYIWEE